MRVWDEIAVHAFENCCFLLNEIHFMWELCHSSLSSTFSGTLNYIWILRTRGKGHKFSHPFAFIQT